MTDGEKVVLGGCIAFASAVVAGGISVYNALRGRGWNEDLEKLKAELRGIVDDEVQKTKYKLEQERLVHEVKFRAIYQKAGEIVEEAFRLVNDTYRKAMKFTAEFSTGDDGKSREENHESFRQSFNALQRYVEDRRIFFPTTMYQAITDFLQPVKKATH
jgi:hypothetical protein